MVKEIADRGPTEIVQDDIFFACAKGRLKLRLFSENAGELIFYQRTDIAGPKESFYQISPVSSPETLRRTLGLAYGEAGRVSKRRLLFFSGRTRIHLDRVEGLGCFIELEVVLDDNETNEAGIAEAHGLLAKLSVKQGQLIEGAYLDMLQQGF